MWIFSELGLKSINSDTLDSDLEIEENYTDGADVPSSNVKVRHPNRNVDKEDTDSVSYS